MVVGTSFENDRGTKIRTGLLTRAMASLNSGKLTDRAAQECVSFLLTEVPLLHLLRTSHSNAQLDGFPIEIFLELVDRMVRSTEKRRVTLRAFEFLPKIASILSKLSSLPGCTCRTDTGECSRCTAREMSGAAFVKDVIERLCRNSWPASGIVNLTIAFRELNLQPEDLKTVADKIIKCAVCAWRSQG